MGIQGFTLVYRGIQGYIRVYKEVQWFTRGFIGGVPRGYRGYIVHL